MREPTLGEYGFLNESEFRHYWYLHRNVVPAVAWLAWLICCTYLFVNFRWDSIFWMIIAIPAAYSLRYTIEHYIPLIRHAKQFALARQAFLDWRERTNLSFWLSLSGRAFEVELAGLLERSNCGVVTLTPATGDNGVDIEVMGTNRTTIIQCKTTQKAVGVAVVRELYGSLHDCGADHAILAITGRATKGVLDFIEGKPITIMGPTDFVKMQSALGETAAVRIEAATRPPGW
jgi:hypothetical protein